MGSFSGLLNNSILLLALCVVYDSFGIYKLSNKKLRDIITGVLVASITAAVMINPWVLKPGVFFDTRGVILGLSGLFFGVFPTSIAVVIAALLRIYQGGPGALPGTLVVISTASVGLIWRYWNKKSNTPLSWKQLYVFGVALHLAFITCLVTLPATIRLQIIATVAPPILVIFPFITLLGGFILLKQEIRRETEKELIENRKLLAKERGLLKGVIDTIPDLIYFKDTEGRYLGCNKAFQDFIEKKEKEILGKFPKDVLDDDIAAYVIEKDVETMEKDKIISYEALLKTKQGKSAVFDTLKTPFKGMDGTLYGLVGISRNMTERIRGEIERKKLEVQLSNALEMANLGPWEYDVANDLFLFNDYFYKIFRTTADEVGGYTMSSAEYSGRFVHPDDRRLVGEEIQKAIEGTDPTLKYQTEHRIRYADGEMGYISVEFFIVLDIDGKTTKTFGVNQDITERKKMEEQLRQAQKIESIGSLAGGIAHDFNNLLSPIIGMSEMLLEDLPQDSLEYENAREILKAGRRAGDLVKQILTFSSQSEHKKTPCRVQDVLQEVLKLSRSTIPSNIAIREDIDQGCGLVMADATQIHQVAMNLMTNAFHAVEKKDGIIDVSLKNDDLERRQFPESLSRSEHYIRLTVADNGMGMNQRIRSKIFDPYFTTKETGKGTGLGLSVVYGIIKEQNGHIRVRSEEGKGSAFDVYLPLMKAKVMPVLEEEPIELKRGTEKILLIDDEVSIVKLTGRMLSRLGYQVTEQTDSLEALNLFKTNPDAYDLVITDMTMPGMTGDRLAREILSIKWDTPIVICTGFSEIMDKEQAQTIGAKAFLMKPVIKSELAATVRKLLDEARSAISQQKGKCRL